jgi:hypothetical protein
LRLRTGTALPDFWAAKAGTDGNPLVCGVYVGDVLTEIDAPELVVRKAWQFPEDATVFSMTALEDDEDHNLQADVSELDAGRYVAEVRGTIGDEAVIFPDNGHFEICIIGAVG